MKERSVKRRDTKQKTATFDSMDPLPALRQAAKNAAKLARETGTALVVWKDGKVVDLNARRKKRSTRRAT